jgi:ankyrin repeat protein
MRPQPRKGSWHPLLIKLIQFAVRDPKLARKLVKEHPEVLNLRTGLGETALHYLAVENYADAVQLLIDLGADVNVTNAFGASALQEAIQVKANETVEVLRRAGAVASDTSINPYAHERE